MSRQIISILQVSQPLWGRVVHGLHINMIHCRHGFSFLQRGGAWLSLTETYLLESKQILFQHISLTGWLFDLNLFQCLVSSLIWNIEYMFQLCWLSTAGMIDVAPQETPGYFPATTVCAAAIRSERLIDLLFSEKHYTPYYKVSRRFQRNIGLFPGMENKSRWSWRLQKHVDRTSV